MVNWIAGHAQKLFVAGHSQGGLFALYFGTKHVVDGVIAIAPGGNVGNPTFREKLGEFVELARKLFAEGKADEKAKLADYEGAKGTYPITTTPSVYLTWFDPEGAMSQTTAIRSMNPAIPVLFIAPANDYPGLLKVKQQMFDTRPKNLRTKLYEPNSPRKCTIGIYQRDRRMDHCCSKNAVEPTHHSTGHAAKSRAVKWGGFG